MTLASCHRAAWVLAAALFVVARPVRADDDETTKPSYRVVIDRVVHEPAAFGGTRLMMELSALTLQGQRLDLTDPRSIKTYVGSSELKAPYSLGTFDATGADLAVVVVVQATLEYADLLPIIAETLEQGLLAKLDERTTQVAILSYGEATGTGKLGTIKSARSKVMQLGNDGTQGDPALLDTLERALMLLKKAKTEPEGKSLRKLVLVISDGRDRSGDRDRVTRLGKRAAKEGVRIHAFAHSPSDQRRPLLLLGELSRRSLGTFRWLQLGKADSWTAKLAQLHEEIAKQYVLTYYLERDDDPAGKRLKVVTVGRTEATTFDLQPELKVPEPACNGEPCAGYCVSDRCVIPLEASGRGVLGWLLLLGGIGVGAILVLGVIGYVITHRQQRIVPPGPLPPGVVPGAVPPAYRPPASAAPAAAPPVAAAPAIAPHLMFLAGPRAGERIPLRHGFMIGKAPGCDLLIEDGYTSSHHAQIGMDHFGNCRLFDRGSTNGTFVNGVRVTEYALEHGVSLRIGSTELRFLAQ